MESSSGDAEDMTVCGSLCYIAVIKDSNYASEAFPDNGSECAVASPWHTRSLRSVIPGDDHCSTTWIEFDASSRERAARDGTPGSGLVVFGSVHRLYRAAAGACQRAILAAARAPNGSPARPQAGQNGKSNARHSDRSRRQGNSG